MIPWVIKILIRALFLASSMLFLSSCASKQPLNQQAEKSKKKEKEKPRPKPLPKIYRPKMMADELEEKGRKPSNEKAGEASPSCDSDRSCK